MPCRGSLVLASGLLPLLSVPVGTPLPGYLPGVRLVTARTVERMAPYPGQARCLALGFWPECFRRLSIKGTEGNVRRKREAPLIVRGSAAQFRGHPGPGLFRERVHHRAI